MGGASKVHTLISYSVQLYLEVSGLRNLIPLQAYYLPSVEMLGSLVVPSLLSDRYSWALVSVLVSLKTFGI